MMIEVCEDCPYNRHPCPEGCSKKIQDKAMTPHIHFLENKFKIALTEKPKMELYGWLSQSSFDDEESGWCLEGGEDAYYEALKRWLESLIEISNPELLPTFPKLPMNVIIYPKNIKEGDSFELPSNLDYQIAVYADGGMQKAFLKLKTEVRSETAKNENPNKVLGDIILLSAFIQNMDEKSVLKYLEELDDLTECISALNLIRDITSK